jgi:hypothetical protein
MIGVVDRKKRLAPQIASDRGWSPEIVATLVVVADGATNRRRVSQNASLLRAAFPSDGRAARKWLRAPAGTFAGIAFSSFSTGTTASGKLSGHKRVRASAPSVQ